jgi:hypothetical protein
MQRAIIPVKKTSGTAHLTGGKLMLEGRFS